MAHHASRMPCGEWRGVMTSAYLHGRRGARGTGGGRPADEAAAVPLLIGGGEGRGGCQWRYTYSLVICCCLNRYRTSCTCRWVMTRDCMRACTRHADFHGAKCPLGALPTWGVHRYACTHRMADGQAVRREQQLCARGQLAGCSGRGAPPLRKRWRCPGPCHTR